MSIEFTLYFVGDSEEDAFAGLPWDDYDDAVECAWDNGFTQVWSAAFQMVPLTANLEKEIEYDEDGFRIDEDNGFYRSPGDYAYEKGGNE